MTSVVRRVVAVVRRWRTSHVEVGGRREFLGLMGAAPFVAPEVVRAAGEASTLGRPIRGVVGRVLVQGGYGGYGSAGESNAKATEATETSEMRVDRLVENVRTRIRNAASHLVVSTTREAFPIHAPYLRDNRSYAHWMKERIVCDVRSADSASMYLRAKFDFLYDRKSSHDDVVGRVTATTLQEVFGWRVTHTVAYAEPDGYIRAIRSFSSATKARLQGEANKRASSTRSEDMGRVSDVVDGLDPVKIAALIVAQENKL